MAELHFELVTPEKLLRSEEVQMVVVPGTEGDFVEHFACGVDPVKAKVLHAVQQPISTSAFEDVMGTPAWTQHPTWYLVATNDDEGVDAAAQAFVELLRQTQTSAASLPASRST